MPVTLGNQNITSSTGNLGIGTDSPAFSLDVNGNGLRIKAGTASDFAKIGFTNAAGNTPAFIGIDGNQEGSLSFHVGSNIGIGGNLERMRIDSAGRVLMPNQPIISGQMGAAMTSPTAPQKLAFDEFWVSRGITYNSSTRRFTVPVAGIYQITLNPFFASGQAAARVHIGINNDVPTTTTHYGHAYRGDPSFDTGCMISVVSLSANDYIVYYLAGGGLYNQSTDRFNQFSITLIA